MSQKRVIAFHINSFLVGGIERVLLQQLRAIDRTKFKPLLIITYHFPELEVLLGEVPKDIEVIYLLKSPGLNRLRQKKLSQKLSPLERALNEVLQLPRRFFIQKRLKKLKSQIDILVDFDLTLGSFLNLFKCPKVGWFHFSLDQYHRGSESKMRRLGRKFSQYNKVIMISDAMLKQAQVRYPDISEVFVRVYNGVDPAHLANKGSERAEITPMQSSLFKKKYIFASGRLDETQKDFSTLIRSYAQVAPEISHDLVIAGDGVDRPQIEALIAKLGISERVHLLGFVSNPLPFLSECDFFVHSSKFEGLPTVLIEALVFGKTIVASDCPTGPSEILAQGKAGYLFPVGDTQKLASLIKGICLGGLERIASESVAKQMELFNIYRVQDGVFDSL